MNTFKLVRIALFSAILFISQVALSGIPNCEVVSLLVVILTICYGKETFITVEVFALLECCVYGFGLWTVMYFYVWSVLVLLVIILKKFVGDAMIVWAVISGSFGLVFGLLCSLVYIPVDPGYALTYWLSGLLWDGWHGVCNFVLMIMLGEPVLKIIRILRGKENE